NASRTMLHNLKTGKWDPELLKLVGIKASNLPAVQPTCSDFGTTSAKDAGFSAPIRSVVGDQQSAAFAQGCSTKGIMKNTYGTGLFVVSETGSSVKLNDHLITTVAASDSDVLQYALEGSVFIGGAGIQWLRDGLNLFKKADETEKIALSINSNGGVYFVPALVGLGCPYWNSRARGLFTGITRGTTAAHFIRAGLEAMAFSTKDVIDVMVKTSGIRVKSLRVDGGAARNNFLMQFQADLLNVPVERPRITETTALGAAGLAGITAGFWKNRSAFLKLNPIEKVFKPKMKPAERKRLCAEWAQAVRRTL
ncbi:MAG: glycerol kinase, partial [Candidatus Omnitrophica bacterium]|nr:glycerol kinase [Candidatus Omnitrophota bacterium]